MEKERKNDEKLNVNNSSEKKSSNSPYKLKKEENKINLNNKKKLYTIKDKISVLEYAKEKNISRASRYFNNPRTTINSWKKQEDELSQFRNKNNFTMNKGAQPKFIDLEDKLYEFFEFNRNLGNAVTIKSLLLQMIK